MGGAIEQGVANEVGDRHADGDDLVQAGEHHVGQHLADGVARCHRPRPLPTLRCKPQKSKYYAQSAMARAEPVAFGSSISAIIDHGWRDH
jgi:hypothetical protein